MPREASGVAILEKCRGDARAHHNHCETQSHRAGSSAAAWMDNGSPFVFNLPLPVWTPQGLVFAAPGGNGYLAASSIPAEPPGAGIMQSAVDR